jgi:hypothetical protein
MFVPYDEKRVLKDQPWLTSAENFDAIMRMANLPTLMMHYILTEDHRIVEEPNAVRWEYFMQRAKHRVLGRTVLVSGKHPFRNCNSRFPYGKDTEVSVSTVFIGITEDTLFESIIFGSWLDNRIVRTLTYEDAERNHQSLVDLVRRVIGYVKRRPSLRKDWLRVNRYWELARKRGPGWATKRFGLIEEAFERLSRIPGKPYIPCGEPLFDIGQRFLPRTLGGDSVS